MVAFKPGQNFLIACLPLVWVYFEFSVVVCIFTRTHQALRVIESLDTVFAVVAWIQVNSIKLELFLYLLESLGILPLINHLYHLSFKLVASWLLLDLN